MPLDIARLDPARTVLLVIDMQNDFLQPGAPLESAAGRAMIPTLNIAIESCRTAGIPVLFTTHVHRRTGADMGAFARLYPPVATRSALIDGTPGVDIHPDVARLDTDELIKKHRYSAFFDTDLDTLLRGMDTSTVVVAGVTTEDCVQSTARDAMFRNFDTVVLSDACATYDHPDLGYGAMTADQVHTASLVVLAQSTAHVTTVQQFTSRLPVAHPA
ncbi:cysteine hydrolase family protein [Nocardia australiensis]|uniref:cysteine hydrolase family protein n=1 Tax=Nocardia australiensis TaxID=2887191 RepID=UPI001D13D861|nr:isochorismatase family cysteine hydrolase [Nocardia australiensis]